MEPDALRTPPPTSWSMLKASAVGDWEACGDAFFSREPLYDMIWEDVNLSEKRVACAPFGGPIATVRDERQVVQLGVGASLQPVVRTFTCAGRELGSMVWERGAIVGWGWSDRQELVVVEANGKVSLYSIFCERLREISLGSAVEAQGVAAALVYGDGVVVLTAGSTSINSNAAGGGIAPGSNTGRAGAAGAGTGAGARDTDSRPALWAVSGLAEPRPTRLASVPGLLDLGPTGEAPALAVIEPRFSLSTGLEVLVGVGSVIWQVDDRSAADQPLQGKAAAHSSTIQHLAVSPDGQFVAAYSCSQQQQQQQGGGVLTVMSSDFSKQLSEFEAQAGGPPSAMCWCGSDALLLLWPELLLVVGPYGDYCSWPLLADEHVRLVPEVDSARLLTSSRHDLIRRVGQAAVQLFAPGSTAPAAQLWDAREAYEAADPRADRALRGIVEAGQLGEAVRACMEAACHDLSIARQKALMRAAVYGRAFCPPSFPSDLLHGAAVRLRVLNALRDSGSGSGDEAAVSMPLTATQLEVLTLPVVVARLVAARQWLLAYRIAGVIQLLSPAAAPSLMPAAAGGGAATTTATLLAPSAAQQVQAQATAPAMGGAGAAAVLAAAAGGVGSSASAQAQVLLQWACAKISAPSSLGLEDQLLKEQVAAKLRACPNIRFAPLAAHAQSVGRRRLALKLLEEESSAAAQVPLLISLAVPPPPPAGSGQTHGGPGGDARARQQAHMGGEDGSGGEDDTMARALRKAVESGDTDLVYLVLLSAYAQVRTRTRSLTDFWQLVNSRALARNLFLKYCREKEPDLLEELLTTASSPAAVAAGGAAAAAAAASQQGVALAELAGLQLGRAMEGYVAAYESGSANEAALEVMCKALSSVAAKYGQSRELAFQQRAVSDLVALRREQARLERDTGQHLFVGLSLMDTISACIRLGHHKPAALLKKQFGVSDKRFCWAKTRTLAEARDWEGLEAYAQEMKRSPIGWESFLEVAKAWNAPREAQAKIVARLPDSSAKAEEYSGLGMAREAAEVAAKMRDGDLFARIQGAVSANSPAGLAIAQIKERFASTFSASASTQR